jgi:lipopolysaccharide transport protein LptA
MVVLLPDIRALALLLAAALATPAMAAAAKEQELKLSSATFSINSQSNTVRMTTVSIANTDGTMTITAQKAVAKGVELNFTDSEVEFTGTVHIHFQDGDLDSDTARVRFLNNQVDNAHAVGGPAKFSQLPAGDTQRREGHANTIDFDAAHGKLHFSGAVWFFDGRNEMNPGSLTYGLIDKSIDADRVRMTIRQAPGKTTPAAVPVPAPATAPAPATGPAK